MPAERSKMCIPSGGGETYVSPEDIWEIYVPMDFRNFKIEGRTDDLFVVLEVYCHYMIKPEYQGQVRIMMLRNMEDAKIISVMNPQQLG